MKKIAKLLAVVALCGMSSELYAQEYGIKAGLNLSNIYSTLNGNVVSDNYEMNTGFHIGLTAEYPIAKSISFETGLMLSTKGYSVKEDGYFSIASTTNLYYLDIPLTAKAAYKIGGIKIFANVGPYVGVGLSGKVSSEGNLLGISGSTESDVEWGEDGDYERLDYGLTFGAGVGFGKFTVGASYELGLADIAPSSYVETNNRVTSVSLGYKF
jgi:hypothetical protein